MKRSISIRALLAALFASASFLVGASASAEPADGAALRVELDIQPCADVSPEEVRRIASLELRVTATEAPVHDEGSTRVEVGCKADFAQIKVLDPLTGKSLARTIALARVAAPARSRLLALAVAELVAASWIELESNPAPVAAPVAPMVRPADVVAAREVVREKAPSGRPAGPAAPRPSPVVWRIAGVFGFRWFAVDTSPLVGLGARVGLDPLRTIGLDFDVLAEHATSSYPLGSVAFDSVSVGAVMRFRHELGPLTLHGGPGLRMGLARMSGYPISQGAAVGHAVDGVWGAPVAAAGVDYTTTRGLVLELGGEVGYVALPVRGIVDGGRDVRADGVLFGATIGAGWAF